MKKIALSLLIALSCISAKAADGKSLFVSFKDCKMKYDKSLKYLHLTKERKPDIKYEKMLIDVAVIQNKKKNYDERKTLRNRLRCINLLIYRERLRVKYGENDRTLLYMLEELKLYIKEKLQSCKQIK